MAARKVDCSYAEFLFLFPYCTKELQEELLQRLRSQPRPSVLCGRAVPESLYGLSYGVLDDLRAAVSAEDPLSEVVRVLLGAGTEELMRADVNDVFGFFAFVQREIEKINKLFKSIRHSYSKEEEAAGVRELDFGTFGVLDWYARRMGITNQNEVRDVAWVRIYQCIKNDNLQAEYERRLQKQYMEKSKARTKRR